MSYLIIIVISLIFSAFFSGMEIAYITSNKLKIELERKQGIRSSKIISFFSKKPAEYIATMLVGNNIALVVYGIMMAIILEPLIKDFISNSEITILTIQTIISTLIILITAEFLPKTLFRINPNFILNFFAFPILIFYITFYPIVHFSLGISNLILKKFFNADINKEHEHIAFGKVDLDDFLRKDSTREYDESGIQHEIKIFRNALDFSKVKLRECIVPRNEIVALEVNDSIETLTKKFIETGLSKILIYKNTIDNIIGFVHSSELFKKPKTMKSMIIDLPIVPETMTANKLLSSFIEEGKSIAIVVDEFGGTSGMVTIEDIIEEIFGEIEDEHDHSNELEDKIINENEYIFSGRLEIDYINEKYNLSIPESDDYETIAGFILYHHENIPKINETIVVENFTFKILKVTHTKIESVNLTIINQ